MDYSLSEINNCARTDPKAFIEECNDNYDNKVVKAADMIIENMKNSPIVLLSGPSASGKTTTAMKIEEELRHRGVFTHSISMDNYFCTIDPETMPRTKDGEPDYESPKCMDTELLNDHFKRLSHGESIFVPKFSFCNQKRLDEPCKSLRLGKDEIAIFEGIHALNDDITKYNPEAFKLYISTHSNVVDENKVILRREYMRLVRRIVRDHNFRGTDAEATLNMWENVVHGERVYIAPFKDKADLKFDSSFPYEVPVLKKSALELLEAVPKDCACFEQLPGLLPALRVFEEIDPELLPPDSLLREFIGGGIYKY
jgi:uridine kinase